MKVRPEGQMAALPGPRNPKPLNHSNLNNTVVSISFSNLVLQYSKMIRFIFSEPSETPEASYPTA